MRSRTNRSKDRKDPRGIEKRIREWEKQYPDTWILPALPWSPDQQWW